MRILEPIDAGQDTNVHRVEMVDITPKAEVAVPSKPSAWSQVDDYILTWGPFIFMALIVVVLFQTMKLMPRTKPQQLKPESKSMIGWADVAGADEAKAELQEVVEFLRDPKRFEV